MTMASDNSKISTKLADGTDLFTVDKAGLEVSDDSGKKAFYAGRDGMSVDGAQPAS